MKKLLSVIIILFPIGVFGQMSFDEIVDKTIEIRERFVNKEVLKEKIKIEKAKFYDKKIIQGSGKDTANIAITLALLYADISNFDSAFYFMEINRKSRSNAPPLSRISFIKIFRDPRFEVYLDSCYSHFTVTNNLKIQLSKNSEFVRESAKLGIIQGTISELYKYTESDYLGLREELRKIAKEFEDYKTLRFRKIVELHGFPTYSEHGYDAPSRLFQHLKDNSVETLINIVDELEKLALRNEVNGEFVSILVDEKLINEGKKQKYGTIFVYLNNNRKYQFFPIENEEKVNQRRKEIGLKKTVEESYKELNNSYLNTLNGGF